MELCILSVIDNITSLSLLSSGNYFTLRRVWIILTKLHESEGKDSKDIKVLMQNLEIMKESLLTTSRPVYLEKIPY